MYWYRISEGSCPDEYVEITLGHEKNYSEDEFLSLIKQVALAPQRRAWNLARTLIKEHGFTILPIKHQHHIGREVSE